MIPLNTIRETVNRAAPRAPVSLCEIAARVLAHPRATSDALLIVSDAIREYADWPVLVPLVRDDTRRLADYLAAAAPARADNPLFDEGDHP